MLKYAILLTFITENWLYLTGCDNFFSWKIVDWLMDSQIKSQLIDNDPLETLSGKDLIWHTDRGNQLYPIATEQF